MRMGVVPEFLSYAVLPDTRIVASRLAHSSGVSWARLARAFCWSRSARTRPASTCIAAPPSRSAFRSPDELGTTIVHTEAVASARRNPVRLCLPSFSATLLTPPSTFRLRRRRLLSTARHSPPLKLAFLSQLGGLQLNLADLADEACTLARNTRLLYIS